MHPTCGRICLLTWLAVLLARPALADKLPSSLDVVAAPGTLRLSADERIALESDIVKATKLAYSKTRWACVSPPDSSSGRPVVDIRVELLPQPGDSTQVSVTIAMKGKPLLSAPLAQTIPNGVLDAKNVRDAAVDLIARAMDEASPCAATLKVKGTTKVGRGRGPVQVSWSPIALRSVQSVQDTISFTSTFEGEATLTLDGAGQFTSSFPIRYSWSPIVINAGVGGATCTMKLPDHDSMLDVRGGYDEHDGSLSFTQFRTAGLPATTGTAQCVFPPGFPLRGQTLTIPAPSSGPVDAAAGSDIRIPFNDSAHAALILPPLLPGGSSDLTLDLKYDRRGGAGSTLPRLRINRALGGSFAVDRYAHRAMWVNEASRIDVAEAPTANASGRHDLWHALRARRGRLHVKPISATA